MIREEVGVKQPYCSGDYLKTGIPLAAVGLIARSV
jgi:hypothetical protein